MAIRVFIYDDNESRRESLKALLDLSPELEFRSAAPDCSNAIDDMNQWTPDVVLMDINMPHVNGIEGLRIIKENFPQVRVLMQTVFDDKEKVFESIRNGASGYILKKDPPQRILEANQEVNEGGAVMNPGSAQKVLEFFHPRKSETPLTDREKEVLVL